MVDLDTDVCVCNGITAEKMTECIIQSEKFKLL